MGLEATGPRRKSVSSHSQTRVFAYHVWTCFFNTFFFFPNSVWIKQNEPTYPLLTSNTVEQSLKYI